MKEPKTFFITGAEGAGKTSIIPILKKKLQNIEVHDFDEVGVPLNPTLQWRVNTTRHWIKTAIKNQKKGISTCIVGLCFPSEVKSLKESLFLELRFCFLEVSQKERETRLRKREASQEVIADLEQFNQLKKEAKNIPLAKKINTSSLSVHHVAQKIIHWIELF